MNSQTAAESGSGVKLAIIVAHSENGVIGREGDLPWRLRDDLRHFMTSTKGHVVVMGRKTFETLDEALPGRVNVVVSRTMEGVGSVEGCCASGDGVIVVRSLEEAIEVGGVIDGVLGKGRIWVAGGGEIYRMAMGVVDEVVRTRVGCVVEGDAYFPEMGEGAWVVERSVSYEEGERNGHPFVIEWLVRG